MALGDRFRAFSTNRWLVFVAATWVQSKTGIRYLFGSISLIIKAALGYNQRQVAALGVAKDLSDCVGFLACSLSAVLPSWTMLFIGSTQNFLGYGWLWLIVTRQAPALPLWMNFPKSRGPTVGIMKGFAGLSTAILTQLYAVMHTPDHATLLFMVAVGPSLVAIGLIARCVHPARTASCSSTLSACSSPHILSVP